MGHCQKSQNNTHLENQILQKTSDYQSARLPWARPCAQVTAQLHLLQQEMADISHTGLRGGCDTSQEQARGSLSMRSRCPSAAGFCLENSLVRAAPGVRMYRGWTAKPKPPAKGNHSLQKLILASNQSCQHSRK